jgi:hypothetical protein
LLYVCNVSELSLQVGQPRRKSLRGFMRLADFRNAKVLQALLQAFDGFDHIPEPLERRKSSGRG